MGTLLIVVVSMVVGFFSVTTLFNPDTRPSARLMAYFLTLACGAAVTICLHAEHVKSQSSPICGVQFAETR